MPYILEYNRNKLKNNPIPKTSGEMNYLMTQVICKQTKNWNDEKIIIPGQVSNRLLYPANKIANICADYLQDGRFCYMRLNDCGGAIMFSALEYIRRNPYNMPKSLLILLGQMAVRFLNQWYIKVAVLYEESKRKQNGDLEEYKGG